MLVAISGSQGSGKSTILSKIKELGYNTIERKTSRSILADWGITLQDVNNDPKLTTKFQDEITKRKLDDEIDAIQSNELWFTERTFIDLLTYSTISLGGNNNYDAWLDAYGSDCIKNQQTYTHVFYLTAGHFSVEKDNIRGHNKFYSTLVDAAMLAFYEKFQPNKGNFTVISTSSLSERINIILEDTEQYVKAKNERTIY